MAIINVNKVISAGFGRMPLRLHAGAIAYHYASGEGVAVRLVGGEAIQLAETLPEFEKLLDPSWQPPKAPKPAKVDPPKPAADPDLLSPPAVLEAPPAVEPSPAAAETAPAETPPAPEAKS